MKTFISFFQEQVFLTERLSRQQIDDIEKFADRLFAAIDIDVDLGAPHFYDRINDARNGKDITVDEMIDLFKKEFSKYKDRFASMKDRAEAVMNDRSTSINLPFIMRWDKQNKEFDMIAKTVMRNRNFKSHTPFFKV